MPLLLKGVMPITGYRMLFYDHLRDYFYFASLGNRHYSHLNKELTSCSK